VSVLVESERLHQRVRAFAHGEETSSFEELALEIARFQWTSSAGMRRLVELGGRELDSAAAIPAVPSDAFRLTRVAVHPESADIVRFRSSGTTGPQTSSHAFRTTETYRELALRIGAQALTSAWPGPRVVVALAEAPGEPPTSSLGFMMQLFIEAFDGRPREAQWLLSPSGIDVRGLRGAAALAAERDEPLLVLGTAFSLVTLLDQLAGGTIEAPERTVIMQTGGFKGRTRELEPEALRREVARTFGVSSDHVVGEYGMTELSSQLYEPRLPGSELWRRAGEPRDVYVEPSWLRVTPVDPATLEPVADGEIGIARILDLGNVDSAVAIVTQDLVRRSGPGIELLGRRPGSPPRGCSLAVEALLAGSGS
jgi:hypothetical protein